MILWLFAVGSPRESGKCEAGEVRSVVVDRFSGERTIGCNRSDFG
jgi:hypothetical protein